ncbi:hypothetical protein OJAV_G00076520 [Oryzias javanicus]|uniref:Uncharacterized protein n=1 Tax=Oryzias javanicus TaxID=123683 RepID=A0A437D368_ORYJA|nr:hypothetical protein OJAV_G00076520 [Oryzias javanicus]
MCLIGCSKFKLELLLSPDWLRQQVMLNPENRQISTHSRASALILLQHSQLHQCSRDSSRISSDPSFRRKNGSMSITEKEKTDVRLVFLGAGGVGKSALIHRFLQDTFDPKHRRTVEEIHRKEYEVGEVKVTINIIDTSGSYSFPAMRKLSIQNGDAFALVYAVDDPDSLEAVKRLRDEILEFKEDKHPPIVVIGNKIDRHSEREVSSRDVLAMVELDWDHIFVESSAKDNINVLEAFMELLQQTDLPSQLRPALCRRRETIPKQGGKRPPMNKTNSCLIS